MPDLFSCYAALQSGMNVDSILETGNLNREEECITKKYIVPFIALLSLSWTEAVPAAGLFGPPQPLVKESGGLRTAVGYWRYEDKFKNNADYVVKQNQIYTEAAYGARLWEFYGRLGGADLTIPDAFRSNVTGASTSKNDFEGNWSLFGSLGGKLYYPIGPVFGFGAFARGTYIFNNYKDEVDISFFGTRFRSEILIKDAWDADLGLGFQVKLSDVILYAGPYMKICPSFKITGSGFRTDETKITTTTDFGGYAGIDVPITKVFHLNVEAQYSERLSAGAAVSFIY